MLIATGTDPISDIIEQIRELKPNELKELLRCLRDILEDQQ